MKDMPGPYKKRFLKLYLRVSEFVHPSIQVIYNTNLTKFSGFCSNDVVDNLKRDFLNIVDVVLYVLLRLYRDKITHVEQIREFCTNLNLELCCKGLKFLKI